MSGVTWPFVWPSGTQYGQLLLTFRDVHGKRSTMEHFVDKNFGDSDPETLMDADKAIWAAASDAIVESWEFRVVGQNEAATPIDFDATTNPYNTVTDRADMLFKDAGGRNVRTKLVAPLKAVFTADGRTVDKDASAVAAYITAFKAIALSRAARAVVRYHSGMRRRGNIPAGKVGVK